MSIGSIKGVPDLLIVITMIAGFAYVALCVRTTQLRKPGVPLFPTRLKDPVFHFWNRDYFTEAGLRWRRASLIAGAIWLLLVIIDVFVL